MAACREYALELGPAVRTFQKVPGGVEFVPCHCLGGGGDVVIGILGTAVDVSFANRGNGIGVATEPFILLARLHHPARVVIRQLPERCVSLCGLIEAHEAFLERTLSSQEICALRADRSRFAQPLERGRIVLRLPFDPRKNNRPAMIPRGGVGRLGVEIG